MLAKENKMLYNFSGEKWEKVVNAMFIGQYKYNIDEKGRLVIPSDFRKILGQTVIINKGIEKCITIYQESEWKTISEKITNLAFTKSDNRKFSRYFFSAAFKKDFDSQGRINLDDVLIEHAKIEKECVIVGAGNVIEIWSKTKWEEQEEMRANEFDDISENIDL